MISTGRLCGPTVGSRKTIGAITVTGTVGIGYSAEQKHGRIYCKGGIPNDRGVNARTGMITVATPSLSEAVISGITRYPEMDSTHYDTTPIAPICYVSSLDARPSPTGDGVIRRPTRRAIGPVTRKVRMPIVESTNTRNDGNHECRTQGQILRNRSGLNGPIHPDHGSLVDATREMISINTAING